MSVGIFSIKNFASDRGTVLPELKIAYMTHGRIGAPAILISTCFGERVSSVLHNFDLLHLRVLVSSAVKPLEPDDPPQSPYRRGVNELTLSPLWNYPPLQLSRPSWLLNKTIDLEKYFVIRVGLLGGGDVSPKRIASPRNPTPVAP